MRSPAKPWYRASKDAWYVEFNGKQVRLAKGRDNEKAARDAFYKLMASGSGKLPEADTLRVATICDLFLDHSEKHHVPDTFRWYKDYLQDFCDLYGTLLVQDLKPLHVSRWLDAHPGWKGARRCAVIAIKRAFNWAEGEGLLAVNPLRKVKKPPQTFRERVLSREERQEVMAAIRDQAFRDFVFGMQETGCRPSEVARVTAVHVNLELGIWVFADHKTVKKTGRPWIVYLTPAMVELPKYLMLSGRIFVNVLPEYLVARNQQDQDDYGIDYEIEVMLPADRASGVIFKAQEKGTTRLVLNAAGDQISYADLKTARMRYYLRELRIPAALVVDVPNCQAYWVRLQGNPVIEAAYEVAAAAGQETMTVHVPVANRLPATLPQLLQEMVRGQDAVMVRLLRDISSPKILDAANSLPDFDATLRAARAHTDILRLEQVERIFRAGDPAGAIAECRRILPSESDTAEARLAAALNIIRLAPALQPPPRNSEQQRTLVEERLRTPNQRGRDP